MNEIDDIKRRAGISENFGQGTDPIQSLVDAITRSNGMDGTNIMNNIMAISGGSPASAVAITLQIIERLESSPGAVEDFIKRIKQSHRTGGYREGGTSGL